MNIKRKAYSYLLILFCVLWSGGSFTYALFNNWPIYAFLLLLFILKKYGIKISSKDCWPLLLINGLTIIQMIVHRGTTTTLVHQVLIVTDVFFTAKIVAEYFPKCFVRIITVFAIISIPFYIMDNIGFHGQLLSISSFLPQLGVENMWSIGRQKELHTLYIYNIYDDDFSVQGLFRNPGPFWEAGRFTIFLNIALLINLFYYKKGLFSMTNIILIVTNITAMSTTGIIAMLITLLSFILNGNLSKPKKFLLFALIIAMIPTILSLDFMTEKISREIASDATYSRFGAISYHWSQIIQSPIIGFGQFLSSALGKDLAISPNGITDAIRYFGIPGFLYIWILLFRGTNIYINGKIERITALIVISLLAFTQTITMSPFYFLIYFFAFCKRSKIIHNSNA